jgi:hypothetical protein
MLSRVSRPIVIQCISKRFGGTFPYFVQRVGGKMADQNLQNKELNAVMYGFVLAFGFGLTVQVMFGVPEGPYYYDENQFMPEEYEYCNTALGRFLYKYWFTSLRVGHWNSVAGLRYRDELQARDRIVQDVRRISAQTGAIGMQSGWFAHSRSAGGIWDRHAAIHSTSPQLLNEMIEYADEHDIQRSRDSIITKVIMEKGEGAFRQGVMVEFGEHGQSLRMPAVGIAPSPHEKPAYYEKNPPTKDE